MRAGKGQANGGWLGVCALAVACAGLPLAGLAQPVAEFVLWGDRAEDTRATRPSTPVPGSRGATQPAGKPNNARVPNVPPLGQQTRPDEGPLQLVTDPSGDRLAHPLLQVDTPDGPALRLDLAALDALPQISFSTGTLWTEGKTQFSGPSLLSVLQAAGIRSGRIQLWALNDYMAELDIANLRDGAPIIATRRDGKTFGVRDSGPLWVVYPYDADEDFRTEEIYAASVWQLQAIRLAKP